MVHKRSLKALQRREAIRAARLNGFRDQILCENVATTTTISAIESEVKKATLEATEGEHDTVLTCTKMLFTPGDVMEDSLGRGTLQRAMV